MFIILFTNVALKVFDKIQSPGEIVCCRRQQFSSDAKDDDVKVRISCNAKDASKNQI